MQCRGAAVIALVLVLAAGCSAYPYQEKSSQAAVNAGLTQQTAQQQQQQQQQQQNVNIRTQTGEQLAAAKAALGTKIVAGLEPTSSGRHIDENLFKTIGKGHGGHLIVDPGPTKRPPVHQTIYYPYPVHEENHHHFPYPHGYPYPHYPYPPYPHGPHRPPPFFPGYGPPYYGGYPPYGGYPGFPPPPFGGFGNFNGFNGFNGFGDPGFIGSPGFNDFPPFIRSTIANDVISTNPTDQVLPPDFYTTDAAAQQLKSLGFQGRYATGSTGIESKPSAIPAASSSGVPYYHFLQLGRM